MKKRLVVGFISIVFSVLASSMTVMAADAVDAVSASAMAYTAEAIVEQDVMNGMVGRAGAYTASGAKGIAFEGILEKKMNLENIVKSGLKTRKTYSSTATQADLVTQNKNGAGYIVERIQCKDTVSTTAAKDTIAKAQSGQYRGAQLVGTTEAAEAVNNEAARQGVNVSMKDSKISTKLTSKVGDKFTGATTVVKDVAHAAGSASLVGAAVDGTIAVVESIVDGDNVYDATGHVVTSATEGAVKGAVGGAVGTLTVAGLAAAGVTAGAAPVVVPIVVGGAAVYGTAVGLEKLEEATDAEAKISQATEVSVGFVKDTAVAAAEGVSNVATQVGSNVAQTANEIGNKVASVDVLR